MRCPNCQHDPLPAGARFCPQCGAPAAQPPAVKIDVQQTAGSVQGGKIIGVEIGQVIGNVYQGQPTADPAEALRIYRRVLVAGSRFLPLRGVDVGAGDPSAGQRPLSLARVYIDLDTKTAVPVDETPTSRGLRSAELVRPTSTTKDESRPLPALEAAAGNPRLVLLGDAGSGKSTFVNHLAHCLAAHALEPDAGWLDHLAGWPQADAVPVVVTLRDFARWLAEAEAEVKAKVKAEPSLVWEFICGRLRAQNLAFAAEPLHAALEQGWALVLFDGLDEIAGRAPARFVRDAVAAFAGRYGRSRHLVTCRTLSYQHADWRLADTPAFELAPFDEKKIGRFVTAWYTELAEQGMVPGQDVDGLARALNAALRRPDLWRLAPNPLLLTVMALVHTHKGRLPDARALLYEETVDILLWRWEQIKAGGAGEEAPPLRQLLLQAGRSDVDLKRALWRLAYEAHEHGGAGEDNEAVADIGELRLLKELSGLCGGDLGWAQQVAEAMKLRAGLPIERQPEVFTFPHRTFQEYLAGAHLAAQADFARRAAGLAGQGAQWREVILLAAGKLVYLSGDLDKPLALVAELCPSKAQDADLAWRKAWLAGDLLLEMGLSRAADLELGKDLLERARGRLAELAASGKLGPVERARAADTLARLGDPRPGVGLDANGVPDIVWCDVPAGEFVMGNTKQTDEMVWDDEAPQHQEPMSEPYRISKYPITVAQFDAFVRDGGYTGRWRRCWTREGWQWKGDRTGPEKDGGAFDLPNHPVVMVTWYEAVAFCNWLSAKLNLKISLPTEAQWEKAARGGLKIPQVTGTSEVPVTFTDNPFPARRYPWGDEITPDHVNYDETKIGSTSAVGIFPKGESPCGALDMSGNVWEWTGSLWEKDWSKPDFKYPYNPKDGREELNVGNDVLRVVRGGSFIGDAGDVRCAVRSGSYPHDCNGYVGFRVVASPV